MEKEKRIRMFELMNYDEFWNPSKALDWLNKVACDYLAVVHDKDVHNDGSKKNKHYHVVVRLKDARTLSEIAEKCGIEKQYIEIKNKFKDACAYCFHLTSNARKENKYQYDGTAVIGSKHVSYEEVFQRSVDYDVKAEREKKIKELLYKYGDCLITRGDVMKEISAEDYDKFGLTFRKMREYRIMKVRNREMNVIYITGPSGSGKTTLAKYFARLFNYDVFVSGSGKDVLDGYDKEECIILDDLRADVFTKAELFKLTDNNTNSSVKSRFHNKDISYCKLMIITSIKAPHDLYNWNEDIQESFKQFARRLNNKYVFIDSFGDVFERQYDIDGRGDLIYKSVKQPFNMGAVFQILHIERKLGPDTMDILFKRVKEVAEEEEKKSSQVVKVNLNDNDDLPF